MTGDLRGDYRTAAGRRIRPGRLYRSANHAMATDADLDKIAALGLAVIVDLRRPEERRRTPSRRPPACAARQPGIPRSTWAIRPSAR